MCFVLVLRRVPARKNCNIDFFGIRVKHFENYSIFRRSIEFQYNQLKVLQVEHEKNKNRFSFILI